MRDGLETNWAKFMIKAKVVSNGKDSGSWSYQMNLNNLRILSPSKYDELIIVHSSQPHCNVQTHH